MLNKLLRISSVSFEHIAYCSLLGFGGFWLVLLFWLLVLSCYWLQTYVTIAPPAEFAGLFAILWMGVTLSETLESNLDLSASAFAWCWIAKLDWF